jgi:hypothetical protein
MNTESKEYKKIVKKIGHPKYKDGDKVYSSMFEGIATIKGYPFFNGFVWMYYFNENEVGCGQEYLSSAYEWIAYNSPTEWKLFTGIHLAFAFADSKGECWDVTSIETFKSWYPEINLEVSK